VTLFRSTLTERRGDCPPNSGRRLISKGYLGVAAYVLLFSAIFWAVPHHTYSLAFGVVALLLFLGLLINVSLLFLRGSQQVVRAMNANTSLRTPVNLLTLTAGVVGFAASLGIFGLIWFLE
jgi:hypothetical protein